MKVVAAAALALLAVPLAAATNLRTPPAFAAPNGAPLKLKGFCQRPDKQPACTEKPCCCWSSFGGEKHPLYASPDATTSQQKCLNPPKGFVYVPEPGGTFSAGYMATLKKSGLPVYENRRLCCLRTSLGVKEESQQDMAAAIKAPPTPPPTTTAVAVVPQPGKVAPSFTQKPTPKPVPLKAGDEFETAKMEQAAIAHLAAANSLTKTASSLEASAKAIADVNNVLENDPKMKASHQRVKKMRAAVKAWSKRRWANLKKLKEASK